MQTVPVEARVAALASNQHGLVSRAQLLQLGVTRRQVEGWVSRGRFDRVLPGVLRVAGAPRTREQRLSAAVLWAGPTALVSHRSAGELWLYDGVRAKRPEITLPGSPAKRSEHVVVHHSRAGLSDRRTRRGLPTTTPERTLVDLAALLEPRALEVAFESARRDRHVSTASVGITLERLGARGRSGADALRALLTAVGSEPPAESALEVIAARVLRESDLPSARRQVEIVAFGEKYRLDFAWPQQLVALECDGRRHHEIETDFEHDRRRWSAITASTGYRIVFATWRRVNEQPTRLVAELRRLMARCS